MAISQHARVIAHTHQVIDREERRLTDLAARDPVAIDRIADLARAWRYRPTMIAAALVASRIGRLSDKAALHAGAVCNSVGRFDQALELLAYPNPALAGFPAYWEAAGHALAGLGRFDEAGAAGEAADALGSPLAVPAWAALARGQDDLHRHPTWEGVAAFASSALAVGAAQAAANAIRALPPAGPTPSESEREAMLLLAPIALETLPPAEVGGLIEALRHVLPGDNRVEALHLERLVRQGAGETIVAHPPEAHTSTIRRLVAQARRDTGALKNAVHTLGRLATNRPKDHEAKALLARYIGEMALAKVAPRFQTREARRIFNLVPFNNELELLQIRLHEMSPWVDRFVIVEARSTFSGQPKAAHFEENKAQFAPYLDKISHVVIDEFPRHVSSAWARDYYQRDMAIQGASGLWAPQDTVLLTDADEIVRRDAIQGFTDGAIALRMKTYRFFLNYAAAEGSAKADGHTGTVCSAAYLAEHGSSYLRFYLARHSKYWDAVRGAGWHFTSLGDAKRISGKFAAYAHRENLEWSSQDKVAADLTAILAGRYDAGWAPVAVDGDFPLYIREHQAELGDMLLPAPSAIDRA